jgi:hypothetical protein
MSSVWIGFIGVVVGGVISTLWQWLAVVRQELSDAVVAARLVNEDLQERSSQGAATAERDTSAWIENRVALARALGEEQWKAVAKAYRAPADPSSATDAQQAIERLVKSKRSALFMRLGNLFRLGSSGGPESSP